MTRVFLLLLCLVATVASAGEPFKTRGYYITFMRMPVMGLPEWKQAIDCFAEDEINVLVLWTAGGFRSKKFPITWQYNRDHANVADDFGRELIDYAHGKNIRVLLGFTPFGYDGVNRYGFDHPELRAKKADGTPVEQFGIHSWGWNLCPAQPESQRFMREYIREMLFEFYPNADGVLIESSDYNICRCEQCGPKYYENEFTFVKWISDQIWQRKPEARVIVFPHYFTGAKVPGIDATAARLPFDPRWGLAFAPHSSHFDADLIRKARESLIWSDAPILGTPERVAEAAATARANAVSGFVPSLEAFSYVTQHPEAGEPSQVGIRRKAFAQDTDTPDGRMPYDALLARIQRYAVREFGKDPALPFPEFQRRLGEHFFGSDATPELIHDLLELQRIFTFESEWYWPSPLVDPSFFQQRAERLSWPAEKLAVYRKNLDALRAIARRYATSENATAREMADLAERVVSAWGEKNP